MDINVIKCGARYAAVDIISEKKLTPDKKVKVQLNDKELILNDGVNFIDGLKPMTMYTLSAEDAEVSFMTQSEYVTLDVRHFGAKGDGINDDTVFIQAAIMACPPLGRVLIRKGNYKVTNIFLKSNVNIELEEGAVLMADTERFNHPIFPGMIQSYDEQSEYNLGTWEGNPLKMFAGIITGIDVKDVNIYGKGVIDGCASRENWWYNEKVMVGAFRPRLLFLNRCNNISVTGVTFRNSPSWTVHPYFSKDISFTGIRINNPGDSPNTDGIDVESCKNVKIEGVHFTLGDDCIALKSGKIYTGKKYKEPSDNILIRRCIMENGHGAVTLGSEMSAGIKNVYVEDCLFKNTDRGLRIKTRRGRGELAVIDSINFRNITMEGVKTPFVANCFYFCDPDGRTSYVQDRNAYPVDERTPHIKQLAFEDIECKDCHHAAAFFMGLPERKITSITMKNINVTFAENAQLGYPAMLCGIEEMAGRGIIAENVEELILENVNISGYTGELTEINNVDNYQMKEN